MKKRLAAVMLSFTTVLALSGCYPTGKKDNPSDNQVVSSDNQENSAAAQPVVGKVSEKIGEVEFNYEISADFPTEVPKIKLKPKQLDTELVKNLLLRDKTVISENGALYKTEDKCTLLLGSNSFLFADSGVGDTLKNFGTISNVYDDFCRSSSKQLKSFSSQNAVERVNKILDEIGIENYGEPHIIPISPEEGNAYYAETGIRYGSF